MRSSLIAGKDLLLAPRNLKRKLDGVLNSVKTIKTKGRIDFQKFKEDFDVFCKEHRI